MLVNIILKHKHDASPVNLPSPTSVYNEELMNKIQENEMLHKQVRSLYMICSSVRDIAGQCRMGFYQYFALCLFLF